MPILFFGRKRPIEPLGRIYCECGHRDVRHKPSIVNPEGVLHDVPGTATRCRYFAAGFCNKCGWYPPAACTSCPCKAYRPQDTFPIEKPPIDSWWVVLGVVGLFYVALKAFAMFMWDAPLWPLL
jgi:hypothetical protein